MQEPQKNHVDYFAEIVMTEKDELGARGAYHSNIDNLKESESNLLSSEKTPSLKMQEKFGIAPLDIVCREGFQKIFKSSDKSQACVKPKTAEKLVERGWAWDEK